MRRTLPLILLVSTLCAAFPARAASSRWTQLGPSGWGQGEVLSLASDPSHPDRVFAGLRGGGVARSGDGGRTWRSFGEGFETAWVNWVVVHPALGRLAFASDGAFLYRSLNDGRTWARLSLRDVRVLAPDPRDPNGAWAAALGGLYRTRDMGATWELVQANLPRGYGSTALAVSPVDPRRMYIEVSAPNGFGLWTTGDGGRTWVRRNRARALGGFALQADPHEARTVYLLTFSEIQVSRNAGQSFELFFNTRIAGSNRELQPRLFALDPVDPAAAYVAATYSGGGDGLFRTTDGGRTWRLLNDALPGSFALTALTVTAEGTVLAGVRTIDGLAVYRSEDRGDSWTGSARGLVNADIRAAAVARDGTIFVGIPFAGVIRSRDGGRTWTSSLRLENSFARSIATDPQAPGTVYAGTDFPFGPDPHFLWKTTDGGDTWTALPYPPVFEEGQTVALDLDGIAVDPTDSQTVFLATELNNAGSSDWAGIFRSRDGGQTWEKVGAPGTYIDVETHPEAPGVVLALGLLGLYRSSDHGATWTKVLPHGGTSDSLLWALAWAPSDPAVVYAYRGDGLLMRSLDGGTAWGSLGKRLPRTLTRRPLAVDPLDPDTLVFLGEAGPVRLTIGAGRMLLDQGLINKEVTVLLYDPNGPLRLLGGTSGAGLLEYRFPLP